MSVLEKNSHPLVSVAVITYNQKCFLRECLESVLAQDYPRLEIVVADDCSTDGTQEMLREYAERYPGRFVLKLAGENRGITHNSNVANFACSGKYIAWMGGDDLMLPGKLTKQVKFMEDNSDCDICYHDLEVFESASGVVIGLFNEKFKISGGVREAIKYGTFNGACSSMVRRSKTPEHGFDVRIPLASDGLYWMQTLLRGGTINYIDEVLGKYRRHGSNITGDRSKKVKLYQDRISSLGFLLLDAPNYYNEIFFNLSATFRGLRKIDQDHYLDCLLISIRYKFNFKSVFGVLVYFLSFGFVKV